MPKRCFQLLNQSETKDYRDRFDSTEQPRLSSTCAAESIHLWASMARIAPLFLTIGVGFSVALGGCAGPSGYLSESQRKAEEAKNIVPENYKADLLAFMRTYLNDPENVRSAALSQPQKIELGEADRYVACLRFNAKNSTGKYTGAKDSLAIFVAGKFDRLVELGRSGASPDEALRNKPLRDFCAAATYQPFPELERLRR
jgi:hypothetical protein